MCLRLFGSGRSVVSIETLAIQLPKPTLSDKICTGRPGDKKILCARNPNFIFCILHSTYLDAS